MSLHVIWDPFDDLDGNFRHIEEGGVTRSEVEEVLANPRCWLTLGRSRSSGFPILFGRTRAGRESAVVFDLILDDPKTIYPITAFEPGEP